MAGLRAVTVPAWDWSHVNAGSDDPRAAEPPRIINAVPGKVVNMNEQPSARRHMVPALVARRLAAALLLCVAGLQSALADLLPPFSWDRVPVAADLRTQRAMTDEEVRFITKNYSFVAIEKAQGMESLPASSRFTEEGFQAARKALKAVRPDMPVLYYWNSLIYYPLYRANSDFDQERWCKRRPQQRQPEGECWRDGRGRIQYDRANPGFQDWWHRKAASALGDMQADGLFIDALGREFDPALAQMLNRVTSAFKERNDRLIIVNLAKGVERSTADYLSMPGVDGFMIEHIGIEDRSDPEKMKDDMLAVQEFGKRGKVVLFKAWPDFVRTDKAWFGPNRTRAQRPAYDKLVAQARQDIAFPLACFLVVAQRHSYFQYSWGYQEPGDGNLVYRPDGKLDPQWYAELLRPLGAPKGDAQIDGYRFRRSFAHADVEVDLQRRVGTIRWANGQVSTSQASAGGSRTVGGQQADTQSMGGPQSREARREERRQQRREQRRQGEPALVR
jgi:hypothetical protein